MNKLRQSWKVTVKHLKASRELLPAELYFEEAIEFEKQYSEYLEHNELELAMNALDDLGILCNVPNEYWYQLEQAALNMGLAIDAQRFHDLQNT